MNRRNLLVVAVVMLLSTSSGCSGMRNFLFGRGARCGSCSLPGSPLNLLPRRTAVPYDVAPYGPPAVMAPSADCGCNDYAGGVMNGSAMGNVYAGSDENCGNHGMGYGNADCNCGHHAGQGAGYADPYLGGNVIGSSVMPRAGEFIPGEGVVVPGTVVPGTAIPGSGGAIVPGYIPGTTLQDNFDTRSNRVMITEPIAPGVQYLP